MKNDVDSLKQVSYTESARLGRGEILSNPFQQVGEAEMKMKEVRAKAKALGMKGTFGLSKAELIRRVQKAEGNFDCFGRATGYCNQLQCCFRDDCLLPGDR